MKKLRKLLALVMVVCMVCAISTTAWAEGEENKSVVTIDYIKYDLTTGGKSEFSKAVTTTSNDTPPDFGTGGAPTSPYTIFNPTWDKITSGTSGFPYKAIAYIEMYWYNSSGSQIDYQTGTGFAIAPGKVLTAAHCLYNMGGKNPDLYGLAPDKVVVKFGKSASTVYRQTTSTEFYVNADWDYSQNADYDYGIISVPTSITAATGHFGRTSNADTSTTYTLSGYPYLPRPSEFDGRYLYTASDTLDTINENTIYHYLNAVGGVSGAPLYTSDFYVAGLHTWSEQGHNTATRMTNDVRAFIDGI